MVSAVVTDRYWIGVYGIDIFFISDEASTACLFFEFAVKTPLYIIYFSVLIFCISLITLFLIL